jgi:hypothetical protein
MRAAAAIAVSLVAAGIAAAAAPTNRAPLALVGLETNTSHRWSLSGAIEGDTVRVPSASSFVVVDDGVPRVTLLYQNFPNPFPTAGVVTTCIWFDLAHDSRVDLLVTDIRGNVVRSLSPRADLPTVLPAGRYGRIGDGSSPGCDPRFAWDGRSSDGDFVPPGAYLVRLRADGVSAHKKVLFRGR